MVFVHEDDVAAAVELALHIDLPGAYNVVPDDWITASEAFRLLGVKRVPRVPMALARAVTYARWRWRSDRTHPSWLPVINASVTFDNSLLKAAGWTPRYTSADALRSATNAPPTMLRRCTAPIVTHAGHARPAMIRAADWPNGTWRTHMTRIRRPVIADSGVATIGSCAWRHTDHAVRHDTGRTPRRP